MSQIRARTGAPMIRILGLVMILAGLFASTVTAGPRDAFASGTRARYWQAPESTAARASLASVPAGYGTGSGFCSSISGTVGATTVTALNLGASYNNVYACGPALGGSWSNDLIDSDFQCVELSARFLWDVYGLGIQLANGGDLVTSVHGQFPTIAVGRPGPFQLPAPGDVMSLSGGPSADPSGHTAVVTAVNVDQSGNGTITVMEENGATGGWDQLQVVNWVETFGSPSWDNGYFYYTNVSWLILNQNLTYPPGTPLKGIDLARVDTSGKGDSAIAVTAGTIFVRPPAASSFGGLAVWAATLFYGTRVTTFADVDGSGKASAVAVNDNTIWVMPNMGGSFGPPQLWSSVPFYGSRGTYLADVDGSGRASAVAVNDSSVWVMLNTGTGFGPPQLWSSVPFHGSRGTYLAVVDGSHRASVVAINDASIQVMPNLGGAFGPPAMWSTAPFYGSRGTFIADIDGSGRSSAVAINDDTIWVETNTGSGAFSAPTVWASAPFYGSWNYMADIDGSGRASAVAVNGGSIWVRQNLGGSFGPPTLWLNAAFLGTH